ARTASHPATRALFHPPGQFTYHTLPVVRPLCAGVAGPSPFASHWHTGTNGDLRPAARALRMTVRESSGHTHDRPLGVGGTTQIRGYAVSFNRGGTSMLRRTFAIGGTLLVAATLVFLTPSASQARGSGGGHSGGGFLRGGFYWGGVPPGGDHRGSNNRRKRCERGS